MTDYTLQPTKYTCGKCKLPLFRQVIIGMPIEEAASVATCPQCNAYNFEQELARGAGLAAGTIELNQQFKDALASALADFRLGRTRAV